MLNLKMKAIRIAILVLIVNIRATNVVYQFLLILSILADTSIVAVVAVIVTLITHYNHCCSH